MKFAVTIPETGKDIAMIKRNNGENKRKILKYTK